jgi:hypothetical protein
MDLVLNRSDFNLFLRMVGLDKKIKLIDKRVPLLAGKIPLVSLTEDEIKEKDDSGVFTKRKYLLLAKTLEPNILHKNTRHEVE